jgi:hypothetical protein
LKSDDTAPPGRPIGFRDREPETLMNLTAPNLNVRRLISLEMCPREKPVRLSEDRASSNGLNDISGPHTRQLERGAGYHAFDCKRTVIRQLARVAQP